MGWLSKLPPLGPRDFQGNRTRLFWQLPQYPPRRRILFVGLPGECKSLSMTWYALKAMEQGQRVWANFPIVHPLLGVRAGTVKSWDEFAAVCDLPGFDKLILIQEANLACPSRDFKELPAWVRKYWAQTRHYGVELLLDAQHENRIDIIMREILDVIVQCQPLSLLEKLLRMRVVLQTWCRPEEMDEMRRAIGGEPKRVWIRGWGHDAYSTHEIMEPWLYRKDASRSITARPAPPERWNGSAFVPIEAPTGLFDAVLQEAS